MSDSDTNTSTKETKSLKKMTATRELIELVRVRRCLWDRTSSTYRDRLQKDKAWYEIYKTFEPNFDQLPQARKTFIGSTITRKWHNARDSYVKSRKSGNRNRPYLYSDQLQFLDVTLDQRKSRKENSFVDDGDEQNETQAWMSEEFVDIDELAAENGISAKRTKYDYDVTCGGSPKETPKEECDDSIVSILVNLIQKEEDEDRAFFKSITPAVKALSENSKFEFRIQVMKLINNLKMRDKSIVKLKTGRTSNVESDSDK